MASGESFWDVAHISLPDGFRPFEFQTSWLNPKLHDLRRSCLLIVTNNIVPSFYHFSELLCVVLINDITQRMEENNFDKENAQDCVTQTLQSILFSLERGFVSNRMYIIELLKIRSKLNYDLNHKLLALDDLASAKKLNSTDSELWLTSCHIYRSSEQWDKCFQEIIDLFENDDIHLDYQSLVKVTLDLAISFSKLSDVSKALKRSSFLTLKKQDPNFWKAIVDELCCNKEYDALGLITIGKCENLMKVNVSKPKFVIMQGADVPGLKYGHINIGQILHDLNDEGLKKWHLKMCEFFIQRDADIQTIAVEFKKPLLIVITMLSFNADTPSFLELAWNKLSPEKLDQRDENNGTAFHFLARQVASRNGNTAEILCRCLLSNGCLAFLKDNEGRLPHELITEDCAVNKMMKEAAFAPYPSEALDKRLKRLTELADGKRKEKNPENLKSAVHIYQIMIDIYSHFPCSKWEMAKSYLKLCIACYKLGDFQRSYNAVRRNFAVEKEFGEFHGKTFYWLAATAEKLGKWDEAFVCCNGGYFLQESQIDKHLMLQLNLNLFPKLAEYSLPKCHECIVQFSLISVSEDGWNMAIDVINQNKLWATLKIFFLGPPYNDQNTGGQRGLLWEMSAERVDLSSIWDFCDDSNVEAPRLVLALLQRGADFKKLSSEPKEGLHSVVRFCALTNDTAVLRHVLGLHSATEPDDNQRTPLHTLCRIKNNKVQDDTLISLAKMLCGAGCDATLKDIDSKEAVDYATGNLKKWIETSQASAPPQKKETQQSPRHHKARDRSSSSSGVDKKYASPVRAKEKQDQKCLLQNKETQQSPRHHKARDRSSSSSGVDKKYASPAKAKEKQSQKCNACEHCMKRAVDCKTSRQHNLMYLNLVTVINEKTHESDKRHQKLRDTCVNHIVTALGEKACPDIPINLIQLCPKGFSDVIKSLFEKKKWSQIPILFKSFKEESKGDDYDLSFFHDQLSVQYILSKKNLCVKEDDRCGLLAFLLDNGAPLDLAASLELVKNAMKFNEFKVVLMLLKRGADPNGVTFSPSDTPLHAALHIALIESPGNFDVFDWLLSQDRKVHAFADLTCVDQQGDTLLHTAARVKCSDASITAIQRLHTSISANVRNNEGKLPFDILPEAKDRRAEFLRGSEKAKLKIQPDSLQGNENKKPSLSEQKVRAQELPQKIFSVQELREEMNQVLSLLPDAKIDLITVINNSSKVNRYEDLDEEDSNEESETEDDITLLPFDINWIDVEKETTEIEKGKEKRESDNGDEDRIDAAAFEHLPWEIECAEEVWNLLKGQKRKYADDDSENKAQGKKRKEISVSSKKDIIRKIKQLAEGDWSSAKRIDVGEESLQLYRVNMFNGSYMLVEIAVAFSPKLKEFRESENNQVDFYSEIIRVWNIVLAKHEAQQAIQKILASHLRGKDCFIKKILESVEPKQKRLTSTVLRYPTCYAETQMTDLTSPRNSERNQFIFCPPASRGKMEFHILKFYSFTPTMVSAIFNNEDLKIDFPFKVTPMEHKFITLPSENPILLLGRSGTGKTTICVYRLWEKFVEYWDQAQYQTQPLLARDVPITIAHQVAIQETNDNNLKEGASFDEEIEEEENRMNALLEEPTTEPDNLVGENEWMYPVLSEDNGNETDEENDDCDEVDNRNMEKGESEKEDTDHQSVTQGRVYNHLHQVFVTKNQHLCGEVRKTFQRLRNSIQFLRSHSRFDDSSLPYTLQGVEEEAFPLFVTSRQILLLLDATLLGEPFFERDENMALKNVIPGWGDQEEIFHYIPLEDSSDEDDDGKEEGAVGGRDRDGPQRKHVQHFRSAGAIPKRNNDNKRECTYEVFAHEIWGKIAKKKSKEFHPSLVWTEIMSFIKGSYEALVSEKGYLDEEQYLEVGQKRAPNFCGDRKEVYSIFQNYQKVKGEKGLFDESDLVFNIYTRFQGTSSCDWVFHEIYVDELQDFTQAELALLIALSHEPNKMFLTGDTAQGIMQGISFRFPDLKSLFHFAKEVQHKKERAIKVPKGVHQLLYNYRCHSGIISLASSVLDILTNYFSESFDILQKDQGLFDGPKPVLIKSCNESDLPLLLKDSQRKTSHIEFGAHQAILVVNQKAKDNIPNDMKSAIVLTIYESKGLEFDDILLYNFFKDSQAVNEWGVVTTFLNDLVDRKRKEGAMKDINAEPLQNPRRPHPLTFNPSLHKILIAELKQLYTALTRARVNVWIFDEDENKSAPIFEYFEVLKLVKSVGLIDQQENFGAQFFSKKSSPKEWIDKGKMFMSKKLYEPAAKCFSMAKKDSWMEKLATAHLLTLKASEQKDTKLWLEAGKLFVQCKKLELAANRFRKAKEHSLAALAYKKSGQMKEAASQYLLLYKYIESSSCLETAYMFDRAIKVLVENKYFEKALNCLHRYHNLLKDYKMGNKEVPKVLIDNRPRVSYSEKHLLCMFAEDYLKRGNEEMMFKTVEKLNDPEEKIRFLKEKGYIERAADVYAKIGRTEDAAKLMLQHDRFEDSLEYARKGNHSHLKASIHFTIARCKFAQWSTSSEDKKKDLFEECEENVQRALDQFIREGDMDGQGQAYLISGCLNEDKNLLLKAHYKFQDVKPTNMAGQIEAFQETFKLQSDENLKFSECKKMLSLVRKGTEVINILRNPGKEEADKHQLYLAFYGFEFIPGSEQVSWNPNHFPFCWKRLSKATYWQGNGRNLIKKSKVTKEISSSLSEDLTSWVFEIQRFLHQVVNSQSNLKTESDVLSLIDTLCFWAKLDLLIHTNMTCFDAQKLNEYDLWASMVHLLDFLPLADKGSRMTGSLLTLKVLTKIRSSKELKSLLCRYLQDQWGSPRGWSISSLTKERAKSSDLLIQACFYESLCKVEDFNAGTKAVQLKRDVLSLKEPAEKLKKYALCVKEGEKGKLTVESHGGLFIKSFQLLVGTKTFPPNTFEAVFKFTRFIEAIAFQDNLSILPRLDHMLFWLEFYSTLTFYFIGKAWQYEDFHFYLPFSYLRHFDIIDMCREDCHPNSLLTDVIQNSPRSYNLDKKILDRQAYIINFLTGHSGFSFSLLSHVPKLCQGPDIYNNAERIIVLALVLLLNTNSGIVNEKNADVLCSALKEVHSKVRGSEKIPERLNKLISVISEATTYRELFFKLSAFLKDFRGESIMSCHWYDRRAPPLQTMPTEPSNILNQPFYTFSMQDSSTSNSNAEAQVQEAEKELQEEEEQQTNEAEAKH